MMIALDIGNSRLKWGLFEQMALLEQGSIPLARIGLLANRMSNWPPEARVVACNVAGQAVGKKVNKLLLSRFSSVHWLVASRQACGVTNAYEHPEKLGADRWAALIATRARTQSACLIVCSGTATTIDYLDDSGFLQGGWIIPGFFLMRRALAENTAQLPFTRGNDQEKPKNTEDAIESGCLHAQVGAIERIFKRHLDENARCYITGGSALRIASCLKIPFIRADHLILEGLVHFGASL